MLGRVHWCYSIGQLFFSLRAWGEEVQCGRYMVSSLEPTEPQGGCTEYILYTYILINTHEH